MLFEQKEQISLKPQVTIHKIRLIKTCCQEFLDCLKSCFIKVFSCCMSKPYATLNMDASTIDIEINNINLGLDIQQRKARIIAVLGEILNNRELDGLLDQSINRIRVDILDPTHYNIELIAEVQNINTEEPFVPWMGF